MSGSCSKTTSWWRRQILRRRPQDCLSRARGKDQRVGDPKGIQRFLAVFLDSFARNQGISRKIVWNTRKCWKRKAAKILMGLVPVKSQIKPGLSKKYIRIHVMSWQLSRKKINTQMLGYLTRGAHITCVQKESGSVLTSLMMEALSWWKTTPCVRLLASATSYEDVWWTGSNPHERSTRFEFKEESSFVGALEARGYKFSGADGAIKVTRGSMTILKGERKANLYKLTESIIISDASATTEKEDTTRLWHMRLGQVSEWGLQVLNKRSALPGIIYCKLDLCKFCIMGRQCRVAFSTSQHKTNDLLDLVHTDMWGSSPAASIGGASTILLL